MYRSGPADEGLLRADYRIALTAGAFGLVAQPRLEVSSFNSQGVIYTLWEQEHRWVLNLREAYASVQKGGIEVRVGKQLYTPSIIEGPRRPAAWAPVDLLDPLEWERIAVPSVQISLHDGLVQAWYAPGKTVSRMPEEPWRLELPLAIRSEAHRLAASSYGVRAQFDLREARVGVGMQHASDLAPQVMVRRLSPTAGQLLFLHNAVSQAYVQTSLPLGSFTVDAEGALVHESPPRSSQTYFSYVLSVNRIWQIGFFGDTFSGELQYIGELGSTPPPSERILDFRRNMQESFLSRMTYNRGSFSYTLEGAVTVVAGGGYILQPSVAYEWGNMRISASAGVLGGAEHVFWGYFSGNDFVRTSFSLLF